MHAPSKNDGVDSQVSIACATSSPEVGVPKAVRRAGVELLHVGRLHIAPPARDGVRPHERHKLPQREPQPLRHVLEVCHRLGRCTAQGARISLAPKLLQRGGASIR